MDKKKCHDCEREIEVEPLSNDERLKRDREMGEFYAKQILLTPMDNKCPKKGKHLEPK